VGGQWWKKDAINRRRSSHAEKEAIDILDGVTEI
jgi:hypothetical protein